MQDKHAPFLPSVVGNALPRVRSWLVRLNYSGARDPGSDHVNHCRVGNRRQSVNMLCVLEASLCFDG